MKLPSVVVYQRVAIIIMVILLLTSDWRRRGLQEEAGQLAAKLAACQMEGSNAF